MKRPDFGINKTLHQVVRTATSKELLKEHLRIPLYKNAYYLIASAATVAILGFGFWIAAARLYEPNTVGLAAALIPAVGLVATLSTLGLGIGVVRFLPSAGERSTPMINSALTLSGLVSIGIAAIFLAGLALWAPALLFIRDRPAYIIAFLLIAMAWTLFGLLDRVFIAKRTAQFVFLKNAVANASKIPLLIAFVSFGAFGIFASAGLAMAAGVLIAVFWFLPSVQRGYLPFPTILMDVLTEMIPYSLGNYVASMLVQLPILLLPLMVVGILGAEFNAYFYIAWAITTVILVIPAAISASLFAEGSHFEALLLPNVRRALKLGLIILVPVICFIFALGDKVLVLFGGAYSQNATTVLWLLALAALPVLINSLYITVNQVRKKIKNIAMVSAAIACLSLGLSCLMMLKFGLIGVGIGFLIGQSIVAVVIMLTLRQPLTRNMQQ